jgi:hypothetical protein
MPQITKSGCILYENHEIALDRDQIESFKKLIELGKQGKIRGMNFTNSPTQQDSIFTVTGVQYPTKRIGVRGQEYESSDFNVIGWFHTFADAEAAVLNNVGDIYEVGEHPQVIIEEVQYGLFQSAWNSTWYEWNEETDGYVRCDKPAKYAHVVGFSIG